MTDRVNVSATDVRKLAAALTSYKQEVETAGKRVQGALNAANWHDPQKDRFEARYRDLQKRLSGFLNGEVDGLVKNLNQLAAKLDEIKSTRL